jgi:hypothetical protein
MRTLFVVFILSSLVAGCASVEPTTQQEREVETTEPETMKPEWYNPLETSTSDSAAVYGFALASATDSSEAVSLAKNSAITNLRYEIDYIAESTRELMAENESSDLYSRASFIIDLRNTVRDLPLSSSNIEVDAYRAENNIYHAYAMASLQKSSLWETLAGRLNNNEFMDAFKMFSEE